MKEVLGKGKYVSLCEYTYRMSVVSLDKGARGDNHETLLQGVTLLSYPGLCHLDRRG